MILGIDEVGRGSWAGPLVVGAVVLGGAEIIGLTDSKKLTKSQCVRLEVEIKEKASGFGLGWVSAQELDKIGLSQALVEATKRAVEQVKTYYDEIVIDGTVNFLKDTSKGKYVTTLKKADMLIPAVSAASIIAKVARDNYMTEQSKTNPEYGFEKHVGYGTKLHSESIKQFGVTRLHRLSFAPLKKYKKVNKLADDATTKQIGDSAEDIAANYLIRNRHQIVERNWKTKYCEIDIISKYKETIYFTEVKYRKSAGYGDGLDAITRKKLNQMKFAAKFYVQKTRIDDKNLRLAVISLSGQPPEVEQFLEI